MRWIWSKHDFFFDVIQLHSMIVLNRKEVRKNSFTLYEWIKNSYDALKIWRMSDQAIGLPRVAKD